MSREENSSAAVAAPMQPTTEAITASNTAALIAFTKHVMGEVWEYAEINGCDVQDEAVRLGILVRAEGGYDPDKHGESDFSEPGDEFFVWSSWFKALAKGGK